MIIVCKHCSRRFFVDDATIYGSGRLVRCSKCENAFFVENKESSLLLSKTNIPQEKDITKEPKPEDYGLTFQEVEKQGGKKYPEDIAEKHFYLLLLVTYGILIIYGQVLSNRTTDDLLGFYIFGFIFGPLITGIIVMIIDSSIRKIMDIPHKETRINSYLSDKEEYDKKIKLIEEKQSNELARQKKQEEQERLKKELELQKVERERLRKREEYWYNLIGKGQEFEDTLAELFMQNGYQISKTPLSGDEGIDLRLKKNGKTTVVQCKAHNKKVSQEVARDLYGSMMHFKAKNSILATIIGGTKPTEEFCKGKPIRLLTMYDYIKMQDKVSQ